MDQKGTVVKSEGKRMINGPMLEMSEEELFISACEIVKRKKEQRRC